MDPEKSLTSSSLINLKWPTHSLRRLTIALFQIFLLHCACAQLCQSSRTRKLAEQNQNYFPAMSNFPQIFRYLETFFSFNTFSYFLKYLQKKIKRTFLNPDNLVKYFIFLQNFLNLLSIFRNFSKF